MAEEKKASETLASGAVLYGRVIGMIVTVFLTLAFSAACIMLAYYAANYSDYIDDFDSSRQACLRDQRRDPTIQCPDSPMSKGALAGISVVCGLIAIFAGYGVRAVYRSDRVASAFAFGSFIGAVAR